MSLDPRPNGEGGLWPPLSDRGHLRYQFLVARAPVQVGSEKAANKSKP